MKVRPLAFTRYRDVIEEIDHLSKSGYDAAGSWSLGQVCWHLSYYLRGSLEGYRFKLPWLVRRFVGQPLLKKLLSGKPMSAGGRTIPKSVPPEDIEEQQAIEDCKQLLQRLEDFKGTPHPSPIFGELTADQCRQLHCIHAAHHLRFLVPRDKANNK